MSNKILVAFDFDHTIVEENTDIVVRDMLPEEVRNETLESFRSEDGWTDYMQQVFRLLKQFNIGEEQIREKIRQMQPTQGFLQLFHYLSTKNYEIIIISDSNTYFISEWLKKFEVNVSKVFSNPAKFVDGLLTIEKYHVQDWCTLSSVNLCKGSILEDYVKERSNDGVTFNVICYCGDGQNDFCPSLRLVEKDLVLARKGMRLDKILQQEEIRARVVVWETGSDIIDVLNQIV